MRNATAMGIYWFLVQSSDFVWYFPGVPIRLGGGRNWIELVLLECARHFVPETSF